MKPELEKRLKRQIIGKKHRFVAVAPLGFEETLAKELVCIGVNAATDCDSAEKNECRAGIGSVDGLDCAGGLETKKKNFAGIKVAGDGKVEFTAKLTEAWKAVAYTRIANRMLMEIASFKAENFGQLEKHVAEIPWELYLDASREAANGSIADPNFRKRNCTDERRTELALHTNCRHSRLYHSDAVEERVRKIIDAKLNAQFWTTSDSRPQLSANSHPQPKAANRLPRPDRESGIPAQHLYINLQDDRCTLWLDLAGEELYKRGHERFVAEAPLKETIAAAMIFEAINLTSYNQSPTTNHQPLTTILDPMAGSGTFSLEAAYIANGLIPGKCRDFALKYQPAFKEATWRYILDERVCGENEACQESWPNLPKSTAIVTSDISERAIKIIRHNTENSPLHEIYVNATDTANAAGEAHESKDASARINPQLKDFFDYSVEDFICADHAGTQSPGANIDSRPKNNEVTRNLIVLLNPPYGKRLAFDAPRLYSEIGKKLTQWANEIHAKKISGTVPDTRLTVAILAPKDDMRNGAKYTCTSNLLRECPALDPQNNACAKIIATSHGGFSLNAIFTTIAD